MNMSLSSRARTAGIVAAAGIATLVGTLAAAGSAGAAPDVPRITVTNSVVCSGGQPVGINFAYDDHVDGHVPQSIDEIVVEDSTVVFRRDELHQQNGDYFNAVSYPTAGQTLDASKAYVYSVSITYDDGFTDYQSTVVNLAGACTAAPTTTTPPAPDPDRFQLTEGIYGCGTASGGAFLEWGYGDYPDGHYAASFSIDLLKDGAVIEHHTTNGGDPSSDGASTGFDVRPDGNPGAAFDPFFDEVTLRPASYSLSITVTYEDGATDKHIDTFNLDDLCNGVVNGRTAAPPSTTAPATTVPAGTPTTTTTTVPTGTLPETGASESTWIIGAVAGLLMTAGAVLFAGARRSRMG